MMLYILNKRQILIEGRRHAGRLEERAGYCKGIHARKDHTSATLTGTRPQARGRGTGRLRRRENGAHVYHPITLGPKPGPRGT